MAKRLTRNRKGSIVLPSGETITKAEQRAFKSAISSYSQHRTRGLQNPVRADKYNMLNENSDFTLKKRSAGFNQFQTKAQFKNKMKMVRWISSGEAEKSRASRYQKNYMIGLFNIYQDDAIDIIEKVSKLDPDDFRRAVEHDEIMDMGEFYHEDKRAKQAKLEEIREQVNKIKVAKEFR